MAAKKQTHKENKTPTKSPETRGAAVLSPPGPGRQVAFYQLLVAARGQTFIDGLREASGSLDQAAVKSETLKYVPADAQRILAGAGLRDEYIFPIPSVLEARPSLVGYYRMILGTPQKSFYKSSTGMGAFRTMEELGTISDSQKDRLPAFCKAMAAVLAELVRQIDAVTERDVRELPLLIFGAQLQAQITRSLKRRR